MGPRAEPCTSLRPLTGRLAMRKTAQKARPLVQYLATRRPSRTHRVVDSCLGDSVSRDEGRGALALPSFPLKIVVCAQQYRQSGLRPQQGLRQLSLTNLSAVSSGATPAGFEADFGRIISPKSSVLRDVTPAQNHEIDPLDRRAA
eukprot:scaffold22093_cov59-Phaeocystis_antarctica.AAC.1